MYSTCLAVMALPILSHPRCPCLVLAAFAKGSVDSGIFVPSLSLALVVLVAAEASTGRLRSPSVGGHRHSTCLTLCKAPFLAEEEVQHGDLLGDQLAGIKYRMERLHASGAIDEARLDVSALRVLRLKEWLGMNESIN